MFEEVMGIPAHPLMVHAAVVFMPLLALGSIAYALVPWLRQRIRWAVVLLAIAAPVAAFAAEESGDKFRARLVDRSLVSPEILISIDEHQDLGERALQLSIALGVVTLLMAFLVRGRASASRRGQSAEVDTDATAGHRPSKARLLGQVVLGVLAVGLALATVYFVVRTGDTGAKAVWGDF
ncbi:MAG TPA: DUF2231 domain-containing protein [Micromonosporaceae bacterium]|nr:DUF2231 domain-containing protein [Micromonosporaceae bacterium]